MAEQPNEEDYDILQRVAKIEYFIKTLNGKRVVNVMFEKDHVVLYFEGGAQVKLNPPFEVYFPTPT